MSDSVRADEVAKFEALAAQWWDPAGPMRPLHAMNPLRVGWVDARLQAAGLAGTALLDVGCGAGLAAEALADMGYDVLGIDAATGPIAVARGHAPAGLRLDYRQAGVEQLAAEGARFGAVTALEVIEHVADPAAFIFSLAAVLRPGGLLFVSTLNRTAASFALAKLGAEYVLRLLPRGTHEWRRFVPPSALAAQCRQAGLRLTECTGMRPVDGLKFDGAWRMTRDLSVNYIACAIA